MQNLKHLSTEKLILELRQQVQKEREVTAFVVLCLHEINKRKAYLEMGYSSLYSLCTKGLGYSSSSACRRIQAAKCVALTPKVIEKLEQGSVSLCAVSELSRAPAEIRSELLIQSEGKSKEEVAKIVAPYLPVTSTLKLKEKVKISRVEVLPPPSLFTHATPSTPTSTPTVGVTSASTSDIRYTVTLEFTKEEYDLLEDVQKLSHSMKKKEAIIKALKLYQRVRSPKARQERRDNKNNRKKEKDNKAQVSETTTPTVGVKEQESSSVPTKVATRHIPAPVRDRVLIRDGYQCSFQSKDGVRCQETHFLELDHVKPFSLGGEHTEENLRVMCGAHNRHIYQRSLVK